MSKITYDALGALLLSLSKDRKILIKKITEAMVNLHLPPETSDAILAALIVQVSEIQLAEDCGKEYKSTVNMLELLAPVFDKIKINTN